MEQDPSTERVVDEATGRAERQLARTQAEGANHFRQHLALVHEQLDASHLDRSSVPKCSLYRSETHRDIHGLQLLLQHIRISDTPLELRLDPEVVPIRKTRPLLMPLLPVLTLSKPIPNRVPRDTPFPPDSPHSPPQRP